MVYNYNELSRRGLIKLNQDFDKENDDKLMDFLMEHGDGYEKTRFSEKVIEQGDKIADGFKNTGKVIKGIIASESDSLIDKIIDGISAVCDMSEDSIEGVRNDMIEDMTTN